jgi:hypothetical protein
VDVNKTPVDMTLLEAINARHSVRHYVRRPLEVGQVEALRMKIEELNAAGNLHIQLVTNEPRGFSGLFAYGSFSGVENYIVMAGKNNTDFDERIGYYGEELVLFAHRPAGYFLSEGNGFLQL